MANRKFPFETIRFGCVEQNTTSLTVISKHYEFEFIFLNFYYFHAV